MCIRDSILIGDRDVTNVAPKDRDIAMVFQSYALYPHMTVAENMGFALKIAGIDKDERDKRVREAAKLLDLEAYLERKPKALSGGQRQRVAMGRAIVREPQVFLMDEPLSNLDAKLRVATRTQIAALQRRLGITTVYVTHDQVEAMTLADRIVVIRQGQIEQVGSPQELYEQPANTFVAGFIGSPRMNFIPVQSVHGKLDLQFIAHHDLHTIGIRPEHLVQSDAEHGLAVTVTNTEYMGSQTLVQGCLPDGTKIEALLPNTAPPALHQTVYFKTTAAHMHSFDAQGNALGRHA